MKKILVPTDFSEQATFALEVAAHIAKKSDSMLTMLHVVEEPSGSSIKITGEVKGQSQEHKLYMTKLVHSTRERLEKLAEASYMKGVRAETVMRLGNPYHGIRSIVTEEDVDLVVMGTKGISGFREMLIGSNTEKVVRYAKCPVLTVHARPESFDYKNIVYATDMNDAEKGFVETVKETQKMYDAKIHLVRINTPNNFVKDKETLKKLRYFANKHGLENFTVNVFNDTSEEEGIITFAADIKADLIAMATHGRTGFAQLFTGSIAEDVVNYAKRPVLTLVIDK